MRDLAEAAECFVLAVDHLGKDMERGSRGASAKEGNADGILAILADKELSGAVKNTRLALRKVREGPQGLQVPFSAEVVDMGVVDHRGNPITSVIIDWRAPIRPSKKDQWPKSVTRDQVLRRQIEEALDVIFTRAADRLEQKAHDLSAGGSAAAPDREDAA